MGDLKLLKPIALFEKLFETKVRLDDRGLLEHAPLYANVNVLASCHGSSLVRIGQTQVLCGVQVKVLPEQVNAGRIVCNVEIGGLANRTTRLGSGVSKEAQSISAKLQRVIDNVVCPNSADQLHIYSDLERVRPVASYILKLDAFVLHDDGYLLDACLPAAMLALSSAHWPRLVATTIDRRNSSCVEYYRKIVPDELVSLKLSTFSIPATFLLLPLSVSKSDNRCSVVLQPTKREVGLWDADAGCLQLIVTPTGRVVDLCMTHAFLPGLFSHLLPPAAQHTQTEADVWKCIFESTLKYAEAVKSVMDVALETAETV
ncbi:hypothetical protein P879_08130 [Paragonimus westermani]|uniref:Ribosomal RNA-processing protein 42 n=1 Tax=Paragonimus westermani TaxID=34504 RepID=A0A8T0D7C8_9TREM|nr:hypothetical protein P879_08130 [Paragonimus westermani]